MMTGFFLCYDYGQHARLQQRGERCAIPAGSDLNFANPASPRGFLFVRWGAFPKWSDADEATASAESIQ